MEILDRKPPADEVWTADVVCTGDGNGGNGCGSTLRVGRLDLRYFAEQEFPWRIVPEAVVMKCPVCSVTTDLPMKHWPHNPSGLEAWTSEWRDASPETKTVEGENADGI